VAANVAPSRVGWCSSPSRGSPSRGAPTVLIQNHPSVSTSTPLGPGDVSARGGADLGPQSRGPAASGHGPFWGDEKAGRQRYLQGRTGHPWVPEQDARTGRPRLLGADAGILLMEDLGPGPSLADSLLTGDRSRVRADLVSYAEALGSMHAWSTGRPRDPRLGTPPWPDAVARGKDAFLGAAVSLGLAAVAAGTEIGQLCFAAERNGVPRPVQGDACPDNVRFLDGRCRIFDSGHSGWGAVVLDASCLLAPFPSCWCFGRLPASVAAPAMSAYRGRLQAAGIDLGPSWDVAMTAALGAWIVTWGDAIAKVLQKDDEWGTTTMRPRLLAWLRSFTSAAGRSGVLPGLRVLAGGGTSGYRRAGRRRSSRITRPSPGPVRRRFRCLTSGSRRCKRPAGPAGLAITMVAECSLMPK
jgi:hypothetical protein